MNLSILSDMKEVGKLSVFSGRREEEKPPDNQSVCGPCAIS